MESGDIRPQVLRAIETVQHFVLILSRRALTSDWIKREWSHARMVGKKVSPVLADRSIKRSDLPPWIRREEVYDISDDERWRQLVRVLEGPGQVRRVPWMPGDVPEGFVPRPTEYEALKQAVLSTKAEGTVALTTALRGAGGYGKTVLADYLCHDPDVRFEFTDGILRVAIGKERDDVTPLVMDLIEKLAPDAKRPGFADVDTAAAHLAELIGEARILLVVDDVWREAQLRPFLRGGPNCVRLVTTRLPQVLPASHIAIPIDEMQATEAQALIAARLPGADDPAIAVRLRALADRLGNWAQMLAIANGWMRSRVERRSENLADTIAAFERRLSAHGLTAFDPKNEQQRNRAIRACVEASLQDLEESEQDRLGDLAILPEDQNVPLDIATALWFETGGLDADGAESLAERLHDLSLLQSLDLGVRTLRLHDNMIWYLRDRLGPEGRRAAHAAMVDAIGSRCQGRWHSLPPSETYGWRFLIRHLRGAGRDDEADRLLTDYDWIRAKLHAGNAQTLFELYLPERSAEAVQLVGRAIALSLPALAITRRELPRQLYGRLGNAAHPAIAAIMVSARRDPDFNPAPRWPGLALLGAERFRFVGHEGVVTSACFSADGARILTASRDRTARLWDSETGTEILALRGHEGWGDQRLLFRRRRPHPDRLLGPHGAALGQQNGDRDPRPARPRRLGGQRLLFRRRRPHPDRLPGPHGAALGQQDGEPRSSPCAATKAGEQRLLFRRRRPHPDRLRGPHGAALGQQDGTEILALRGHEGEVTSACFSADGTRILTASR